PRSSPERPPPQGWRPRARGTPQESRPLPAGAGGSGPGPQKGGATRRSVARAARGPPSGHTAPTPAGAVPASPEPPANRQRGNRGRKGPSAPPPHLAVASFPPSPLAAGAARRQIVTISFSNGPQAPGSAMPGAWRRGPRDLAQAGEEAGAGGTTQTARGSKAKKRSSPWRRRSSPGFAGTRARSRPPSQRASTSTEWPKYSASIRRAGIRIHSRPSSKAAASTSRIRSGRTTRWTREPGAGRLGPASLPRPDDPSPRGAGSRQTASPTRTVRLPSGWAGPNTSASQRFPSPTKPATKGVRGRW